MAFGKVPFMSAAGIKARAPGVFSGGRTSLKKAFGRQVEGLLTQMSRCSRDRNSLDLHLFGFEDGSG